MNKNKYILLTGGAGYIGSHIAAGLEKTKFKTIIVDNLTTGYEELINKKSLFIKGDIKNIKLINKILKKYKVEHIIHLAAHLNVNEAESNKKKYYMNNIMGTLNLMKACKSTFVKNVIFSSSCSIYGSVNGPVSETKKPKPMGYYAFTKLKGEQIIKKYSKRYNFKYAILRYFNVAGASDSKKIGEIDKSHDHLFKNIAIASLKKNPIIKIYGKDYKTMDGTCVRDYIHVSDLANIHIKSLNFLIKKNKSFLLNCGYGKGYSVLEISNIFKIINKKTIIKFENRRKGDIDKVYADTKKFNKLFKFKFKFNSISKILNSAIKWEKLLRSR